MTLYFLRHGDAEAARGNDAERRLTAEGRRKMALEGRAMRELGIRPARILASPLRRAKETAEIVARELGAAGKPSVDGRLSPGFGPGELAGILADHAAGSLAGGDLLLVGHEPDLSTTIEALTGHAVIMTKGAIARVDLGAEAPPSGTLAWLKPADDLL